MTLTHEPGTIRHVHYNRGRVDGKFPVTYWGSIDEQIAEATAENARATSRHDHIEKALYVREEDCPHSNPEEDERYSDVEDLVDEWMRRNAPGLTWRDGDLYYKNRARGQANVPLYVEWSAAQKAYDDVHNTVCLDNPMGSCCEACTDGDDDWGYEPAPCRLASDVREAYDEFWYLVSADAAERRGGEQARPYTPHSTDTTGERR